MAEAMKNRRPGDRKEGRLIRSLSPFYNFIPFIMVQRNDACNHFETEIEITNTDKWLRTKRIEGYKGLGMLHVFIASYVRLCNDFPGLNRFISGQRIYARNDITIVLTVKREMKLEADETTIKVDFSPADTIFDVYEKFNKAVDEIKENSGENNTEAAARAFCKLPRFVLKFIIWCLRVMDYFDLIPMSLLNASPFHGTMIITDMGSLGIPSIYHHLYNFGNLPVFISFGSKYKKAEISKDGTFVERKYIDSKVVCDERIVDGMYYATAFRYMKHYLSNPQLLEVPPEVLNKDVD